MSITLLEERQPIVTKILKNAFSRGRVAHAYLLEGPKGTGKFDAAMFLTKMYFCQDVTATEPCEECSNCKRIDHYNHPDVFVVEPDGLSIKKEQIAALQKEFAFSGYEGNKKVYIIKGADKMSTSAANSLLKFLEEPNEGTVAILLTEEMHRMLNTILSRCQQLSFKPLSHSIYVEQLINSGVSMNHARLIASLTNNLTEAVEMSKEEKFLHAKSLIVQFGKEIQAGNPNAFIRIAEVLEHFKEKVEVELAIDLLILFFKDLLYAKIGKFDKIVFVDETHYFEEESQTLIPTIITSKISAITNAKKRIYSNVTPQLILEQIILDIQSS